MFWRDYFHVSLNLVAVPKGDVTRNDSQPRFVAQHSVAILEQCCNHSKQCCSNDATLRCAKIVSCNITFRSEF